MSAPTMLLRTDRRTRAGAEPPRFEPLDRRLVLDAVWDGGPAGNGTDWATPANWVGDVLPVPGDNVLLGATGTNPTIQLGIIAAVNSVTSSRNVTMFGGGLTLSAPSSFASGTTLSESGGVIGGAGDLTINGTMTWTGGSMSGTGRTLIAGSGSLTLGTIVSNRMLSRTLEIDGTTTWSASELRLNGGTIQNDGSFTIDGAISDSNFGGTNAFNNNGTLTKAGGQTVALDASVFTNNGTIDVAAGTIDFGVLPHVFNTGGTITGTLRFVTGTPTVTGTWSGPGTLAVSGGTFTIPTALAVDCGFSLTSGTIDGAGTLTLNGASSWTGGAMAGTGRTLIGLTGSLTLGSLVATRTLSRTLEIDGTALWSASDLRFNGGTIQNDGAFTINGPASDTNFGGVNAFINNGTVTKAGPEIVSLDAAAFANNGILNVAQGTLDFSTASHAIAGSGAIDGVLRFVSGTSSMSGSWTGAGSIQLAGATLTVDSPLTIDASFSHTSGTLAGTGVVTLNAAASWTGGTIAGAGRTFVSLTGSLTLGSNVATRTLSRTLEIDGSATWSAGDLRFNGGTLQNDGTFTINGPVTDNNFGGVNAYINNGTFIKADPSTMSLDAASFTSPGTLNITGGVLELSTFSHALTAGTIDGALRISSGGQTAMSGIWAGAGTLEIASSGTLAVDSSLTLNMGFAQSSGTLSGAGVLSLNGASTWTGGAMSGAGSTVIGPGGTLTLGSLAATRTLSRTLDNNGTLLWTANDWRFNGATLQNDGTFTISASVNIQFFGGTNAIVNAGGMTVTTTGPGVALNTLSFTNAATGVLVVEQGTLTISPPSGPVFNNGLIRLGSTAHLHVAGGFTQTASGGLAVDVGGPLQQQYGRVTATGVATIAGTLSAALVNGYTPALFTRFDVVTGSTLVGTFATIETSVPGQPTRKWITLYQPNRAQLVYTSIADWNSDGLVNSTDVSDFINDWFTDQVKGGLTTDFNGDGISNSTDVSDFINLWFEDQSP